ncbi:MAG: ABC transporter ATP-binding protein [Micrococcales bacterium]|nr:ABC transporter ATP-binding protein [Micrococcales bacterium]
MPDPLLDVRDLHVRFGAHRSGEVHAVRGVDLRMAPGEVLGLVGGSGAGKSALVSAVLGLLPHGGTMTGSVRFEGTELVGLGDRAFSALRGPGLAVVFQDSLSVLDPVQRVGAQVVEVLRLHDRALSRAAARSRTDELFALVGLPSGVVQAFAHEVSGGMRQRVGIALAIACSPRLLIADEPTSALDVTVQAQVLDVLDRARQASGAGLLLVTHDLGVVAGWTDRVAVMHAGRVVEQAGVTELFEAPREPRTVTLLRAAPDPRTPRHGRRPDPGEPVLEVTDLRVTHRLDAGPRRRRGQVVAVDGVSLTVRRGEVLALVGESGAGKTSVVEQVFALSPPREGGVRVLGHDLTSADRATRRRLRGQAQLVVQDTTDALDPRMSVGSAVAEPLAVARVPRRERRARVVGALEAVGLGPGLVGAYPHELSGGERRRVAIARALVVRPTLLALDEPVAGLDVSVAAGLLGLLADLRDDLGLTCLVVTHDLAAVRRLADRVAVMVGGRVVEEASTDALFDSPAHPYTRALLAAVPVPDPRAPRPVALVTGERLWTAARAEGCCLADRCPLLAERDDERERRCREVEPGLVSRADRTVACHWWDLGPSR